MSTAQGQDAAADELDARHRLNLLETFPADRFDRYARLIRRLFDLPAADVNFNIADGRRDVPCEVGLFNSAIADDDLLVVEDASQNPRFAADQWGLEKLEFRFCAVVALKDGAGQSYGTLYITDADRRAFPKEDLAALQDVASMVTQELASLRLAVTDELTELCNRRGFELLAEQAIALCRRMDRPAAAVMIDMTDLAEVNDRYGHAAGDQMLRRFANLLLSSVRESDVVARIGGDEFAVLLTGTDVSGAEEAISRIRAKLDCLNDESPGDARIGFSAGCALCEQDLHPSVFDALRDADAQMYRAKSALPDKTLL